MRSIANDGPALLAEVDAMAARSVSFASALEDLASLFHRLAVGHAVPAAVSSMEDSARIAPLSFEPRPRSGAARLPDLRAGPRRPAARARRGDGVFDDAAAPARVRARERRRIHGRPGQDFAGPQRAQASSGTTGAAPPVEAGRASPAPAERASGQAAAGAAAPQAAAPAVAARPSRRAGVPGPDAHGSRGMAGVRRGIEACADGGPARGADRAQIASTAMC